MKIFGSHARGTATPSSDIDVLYTPLPVRKLGWEIEQLAHELVGILGHQVDLVSRRALDPRLGPAVIAEARSLNAA